MSAPVDVLADASTVDAALNNSRATFTAADPVDQPAPFLLADGRVEVTPENCGEPEHVAAINAFKRRLRECNDPRAAAQPERLR